MNEQPITWHVLTHEHRDHSTDWFWSLGLLAIGGAALCVYFGNVLFAIILLLGAGSIAFLALRGPREHMVKLDTRGITLDGTLYPYRTIQSFWVEEYRDEDGNPGEREAKLFLTTTGLLAPYITIALDSPEHAGSVREYLKRYVTEEEQWPHFGEHVAEILGL